MIPMINEYQLIGDSQLLRFSEQMLKCTRKKRNGLAYVGLCVSGQTTSDLLTRVINEFCPVARKAILMIGTNDLLKGTNSVSLRQSFHKLVVHLCTVSKVKKLVLLTIPPVPRLAKSSSHWRTLKEFNECIRDHHNGEEVIVIDAYLKFIKTDFYHNSIRSASKSTSPTRNSRSSLVQIYASAPRNSSSSLVFVKNDDLGVKSISPPSNSRSSKNLRIQVDDSNCSIRGRKIYIIDSDDEDDSDDQDSCNLSINTTPTGKRSSHLVGLNVPSPKRQSLGSESNSTILDDHNDDFYQADDSKHVDQAEEIISDHFEKFFDSDGKRPDQIHLNFSGLEVIYELLSETLFQ